MTTSTDSSLHSVRRPECIVLVTGTGTDVGKTWVAAQSARLLRSGGTTVAARKPVQSFDATERVTDAHVLAEATGDEAERVCPPHRWYERALAPPMAAAELGRPAFTITDLVTELEWPGGVAIGLVEGAGGPRSPLAADGDTVDFAHALRPDLVVIVSEAGLGCINAARLCAAALQPWPLRIVLNRYDPGEPLHRANRYWLGQELDVMVSAAELVTALTSLGVDS